ncbi:hypothetical protein RQP46_002735 [Phenoliferia psychrophenolica]
MGAADSLSSSTTLAVLLGTLAFGAFLLRWSYADKRAIGTSRRDDLHDPVKNVFLLGGLGALQANIDRMPEYWMELVEGNQTKMPVTLTAPFKRWLFIETPAALEYIQHANFSNYVKGPATRENMKPMGGGIFTADGPEWQAQRKATSKIFTANAFRGLITDSVQSSLMLFGERLSGYAQTQKSVDLSSLFFAFTLDSFSKLAFGRTVGALDSETPVPFATAFDYAQEVMAKRFFDPLWKISEMFSEQGRRMKVEERILDEFVYDIIDKREASKGAGDHGGDLLGMYMRLIMDDGSKMDRVGLRDAVLNMLIAGRDTTAQTLSWIFYHLVTNPAIMAKIREELDSAPAVTYDTYKGLTYTNAVFNENNWQALGPDQIPNGPRVETGDLVFWSDWAMGRSTKVWGEDAKEFKPERWINEDGGLKTESIYKMHGFNGGYRLCLGWSTSDAALHRLYRSLTNRLAGKSLATFEAVTVMAAIISTHDLAFAPGYLETVRMDTANFAPMYATSLTLPMLDPLMVKVQLRDSK